MTAVLCARRSCGPFVLRPFAKLSPLSARGLIPPLGIHS
jgi:hypothetical protein